MKPGDHPDFFRLPPPPGRSRESTIRLDAEGRFWHEGRVLEHAGMATAFASWIARHPDDGRYVLNNGYDWSYFEVEDVPFFVRGVRIEQGWPILALSDGSDERLDPKELRVGARDALYTKVKQGAFAARFTPRAQLALSPLLVEGDAGRPELRVGGERYAIEGAGAAP
jgi:hypothetical protein